MQRYKSGFYFKIMLQEVSTKLKWSNTYIETIKMPIGTNNWDFETYRKKNLTICLAKTMISLPLSSHFETSMSNLRFSTLNTSTCSRILALSCSGIFFIASRAVVMPDTSGYSSTSGPGSIKIRKIKSVLVYFSTGLFQTEKK